jgi:hypothetical protein
MKNARYIKIISITFFIMFIFSVSPQPVKAGITWNPISDPLVPCGSTYVKDKSKPNEKTVQPKCNFNELMHLAGHILSALIYFAIPLAVIAFVYAGFQYLTAGGNEGQIKKAHEIFKDVGLGLIIVLTAWLIVNTILEGLLSPKAIECINSEEGVNLLRTTTPKK